jgi:hypothetical protein
LPVTYDDFELHGVHRSIPTAIEEAVALSFLVITHQGRGGNAEWRKPTRYRVTFEMGEPWPTHEWKQITKLEAALAIQAEARGITDSWGCSKCSTLGNALRYGATDIRRFLPLGRSGGAPNDFPCRAFCPSDTATPQ